MQNKLKRAAALLAVLGVSLTSLAGCGGTDSGAPSEQQGSSAPSGGGQSAASSPAPAADASITYPLAGGGTLSIACGYESQVGANYASLADTPYGQQLQKETGVTLEFQHMADNNAMNLLFTSGELPDIIFWGFSGYPGGTQKAIEDDIIHPLNDLIEQNAPDLLKTLQSDPDYLKGSMTANGDYIGFPFIKGDPELRSTSGLIVRDDWCEELGIALPKTADQFIEMLRLFKEKKGAEVPLSATNFWVMEMLKSGIITSAFGLPKSNQYQLDGKAQFGFAQPEYKQCLEFLSRLYTEGLLDPNFATLDNETQNANMMNGKSGVTLGALNGGIGNFLRTMQDKGTPFHVVGIESLVKGEGDRAMSGYYEFPVTGLYAVITPSCQNKELAAQFLNYGYTEAGALLNNFGVAGESYTLEGGEPVFTDLIVNNPEGLTMQLALAQYARSWASGWFVQDVRYLRQYAALPEQQAALKSWSAHDGGKYQMPPVSISIDDAAEYSSILSDVNTYVEEMTTKYILGVESLDTFDEQYLRTLEGMNIARATEILQTALDEFNARQ